MVLCPLEGWSLEVGEGWTDVGWEKGQQDASSNKKNVDPLNQKTYRGQSAWGPPIFLRGVRPLAY